jgi:UDP-2-acetamido-3-amino-2,3-dideoxy-glucuronate N-acetyltransferase
MTGQSPDFTVHPLGVCESPRIGSGTRIWAFAHVLPGAAIGRDCNVCDHVFIENDVVVGDRVTIKCGVQLWDGLRVGDDVFIGPNATFTNDKFPRSKHYERTVLETHVGDGASIGAGAVVLPGVKVGARAMVGAGSVVTHDVPPRAIVTGNPARIVGYVDTARRGPAREPEAQQEVPAAPAESVVKGVTLRRLRRVEDIRGSLAAGQCPEEVPFVPRRFFLTFDVPGREVRGEHAHRRCHQFIFCARGAVSLVVDDGRRSEEFRLDSPHVAVHVPPMIWTVQYNYSPDALLVVLASEPYDPADYIRDYDDFLASVEA